MNIISRYHLTVKLKLHVLDQEYTVWSDWFDDLIGIERTLAAHWYMVKHLTGDPGVPGSNFDFVSCVLSFSRNIQCCDLSILNMIHENSCTDDSYFRVCKWLMVASPIIQIQLYGLTYVQFSGRTPAGELNWIQLSNVWIQFSSIAFSSFLAITKGECTDRYTVFSIRW